MAITTRYFEISRQQYYTWLHRYRAEESDGLRDRSRRTKTSPGATHTEIVKTRHLRPRDEGEHGEPYVSTIMCLPPHRAVCRPSQRTQRRVNNAKNPRPTDAVSAGPHRSKWSRRQPCLVAQKILSISRTEPSPGSKSPGLPATSTAASLGQGGRV